ncbi:cation-transporting ATPase [Clostridium putrefaciens]|uniref:Cation-transporting ATPase n=1 Tax=Clostridium putrefaciens TaxID=99675 RepID=A0A381JAP6_9CLOT|nr:cation-transporting P-type ATPase [Clostridium putrefaciens]SUY47452.1 cation-transporting ATPase [Clostridium putrefaciens]
MNKFYNMTWNLAVEKLETDKYVGLSKSEVIKRRETFGSNVLEMKKPLSLINLTMRELLNVWVLYALISIFVSIYFGEFLISIIGLLLLIFTFIFNIKISYKNEKSLRDLQSLNETICTVLRDAIIVNVNCKELVVGDIVILDKGSTAPSDLRLIESEDLEVKETLVTGEFYNAEKYETKIEEKDIQLADMKNIVFKGSKIVKGRGIGVVIAIGEQTEIGKTVKVLDYDRKKKDILDNKVNMIINSISVIFIGLIIAISIFNLYLKKEFNIYMYYYLILCFCPTGFLLIFNIYSVWIKDYWNKRGIKIKSISIFHLIKDIDMIFLNKVGSISEDDVNLTNIYTDGAMYNITEEKNINTIHFSRFLNIALLCNNSFSKISKDSVKGTTIDQALIKYAKAYSVSRDILSNEHIRIFEIPYDSDKRIQTTLNKIDNNFRANTKGSVEALLERCTHIMKNGVEKEITEEDISEIKDADISISSKGLKTIGFAYRNFNYEPSILENVESNLVLLGIAGFKSTLKENIDDDILNLKKRGIRVAIATEDNKLTAYSWGKDIKIIKSIEEIWSGVEMRYMEKREIDRNINKIKIFSKISSEDKVAIVEKWNEGALKVLCAGENMTELPAMSKASVSISVGESSEVVKNLSDVYINNDCIGNLNKLINLSPKLLIQIKRSLNYFLTSSLVLIFLLFLQSLGREGYNINKYALIIIGTFIIPIGTLNILISCNEKNESNKLNDIYIRFPKSILKATFMAVLIYGIYEINLMFFNEALKQQIYLIATSYFIIKSFNGGSKYSLNKLITRILFLVQVIGLFLIVFISTNYFEYYMQINDIISFLVFSAGCYLFTRQKI